MYLLDTHTFMWFVDGNSRISNLARSTIEDTTNAAYVSIVSFWEIAIKRSLQKLDFTLSFQEMYDDLEN